MGKLILIRHGQASAHSADYDQLSPMGYQQGERLGKHWATYMETPDRVYVGSLRRHHQTLDSFEKGFNAHSDQTWPEREEVPAFDEYDAHQLLQSALPEYLARNPALKSQFEAAINDGDSLFSGGLFWKLFVEITRLWVSDQLSAPDIPKWRDFHDTVVAGIEQITERADKGSTIAVFTSGGPISVAFGHSLQLAPSDVLETSWRIYNASLSQFLFSPGRFSVTQLNAIPHLPDTAVQTLR